MGEETKVEEKENMVSVEEENGELAKRDQWMKEAREQTMETLPSFLDKLKNEGNCGYGLAVRATACAALGGAWAICKEFGITGFQASCAMWDFIVGWMYNHNKCGLKMVDYDKMLYPQYESYFEKTITQNTWDKLQEQAKEELLRANEEPCSGRVIEHWKSIAEGNIPFGYSISED